MSRPSIGHMAPQLVAATVLVGATIFLNPSWNAAHWTGLTITTVSAVFFLTARYQLGNSFSVTPQARQLVTRGIYSHIRNPLYVFSTLMILGAVIAFQKPAFLAIPAALVIIQTIRARREARVLEETFGEQYRQYRRTSWF